MISIKQTNDLDNSLLGPYSLKLSNYKPTKKEYSFNQTPKILRIICQRPYFTGSGINLINLTKQTKKEGIDQFIIFGQPVGDENPFKGIIDENNIESITFQSESSLKAEVPFPVAGMSDQMPYKSTRFSDFNEEMLEAYLCAFANTINTVVASFKPSIIHCHHLWLVTALCRVLNPNIPIIATCHNTALRQMILSPQLKRFVINPIRDLDCIAVMNKDQESRVRRIYRLNDSDDLNDIFLHIGQGINIDIFCPSIEASKNRLGNVLDLTYVGKLCNSKGVPQLIESFKLLLDEIKQKDIHLNIVGAGDGQEKMDILRSAQEIQENITFHGQLNQEELAKRFRASDLFILPSFYDGFPKVLLESLACGCKAIMTDVSGVKETLVEMLGEIEQHVHFLPLPRMKTIDQPLKEDLPNFIDNLKQIIKIQLENIDQKDYKFSEKIRSQFGAEALFNKYKAKYMHNV